jgi:hypothetical protein
MYWTILDDSSPEIETDEEFKETLSDILDSGIDI